jgi:hypothetical protein
MSFDLAGRVQSAVALNLVGSSSTRVTSAPSRPPVTCTLGYKDQAGMWVWKCPDCGPRAECIGLSSI